MVRINHLFSTKSKVGLSIVSSLNLYKRSCQSTSSCCKSGGLRAEVCHARRLGKTKTNQHLLFVSLHQSWGKPTEHKEGRPFSWCWGEHKSLGSGSGQSTESNWSWTFMLSIGSFSPSAFLHISRSFGQHSPQQMRVIRVEFQPSDSLPLHLVMKAKTNAIAL